VNYKTKRIILLALLVAATVLVAYWLNNAVLTYKHPGYRLGDEQEGHPSIALLARIATFTVFLSILLGLRSIRRGYTVLSIHLAFLLISGVIVLWL
jgi:hypothetical protein